jgi:hypothetical protein
MPETVCFQVPADHELETIEGWSRIAPGNFSGVRAHIIIIKRRGLKPLMGPTLRRIDVPAGSEPVVRRKKVVTVKRMGEIQQIVQQTVTGKITQEFSQKIGAEIGVSGALPTAKAASKTQFKATQEVIDELQSTLSGKRSFEVQIAQEDELSVTVKTSADGSRASAKQLHLYTILWPWRWDFYVDKVELLRLKYEKRWIWPDVRKTFSYKILTIREPLFSLSYYEPQEDFSISDGEHSPKVEEAEEIRIDKLTEALPNVEFPLNPSLEEIARLAFPVTDEEKRRAARRVAQGAAAKGRKVGARSGTKKTAARNTAAAKKTPAASKAPKRTVTVKKTGKTKTKQSSSPKAATSGKTPRSPDASEPRRGTPSPRGRAR